MKINLYCDVLLIPPAAFVKAGKGHVYVERFVKSVSLSALLVPGQTYQMREDPVTGNPGPSDFLVVDSGVFEDKTRQIPYMVVKDDYWLAFEPWLQHGFEGDQSKLPFNDLVALWRQQDEAELEQVKWRFHHQGWSICSEKRQPSESVHTFE